MSKSIILQTGSLLICFTDLVPGSIGTKLAANSVTSVDVQARVMVDLILEGGYNYVSAVHTEGRRHPETTNKIRRHKVSAPR